MFRYIIDWVTGTATDGTTADWRTEVPDHCPPPVHHVELPPLPVFDSIHLPVDDTAQYEPPRWAPPPTCDSPFDPNRF